jgi:hypothetical protein
MARKAMTKPYRIGAAMISVFSPGWPRQVRERGNVHDQAPCCHGNHWPLKDFEPQGFRAGDDFSRPLRYSS